MVRMTYNPEDIPVVARTKFPANVHVPGVVSSKGNSCHLISLKKGKHKKKCICMF